MRSPFAVRSMVAVLSVWALVTIVPDLIRPFAPLATIGLTVDFAGRIVSVDRRGPAAGAHVLPATPGHAGDRIDFARTPADTLFALYGGLGGRPFIMAGRSLQFAFIAPDGTSRTVALRAADRDPPQIERVSLFLAGVLGIGFVVLGAFLAWQFPQRRDVFGFFLYAMWFNPGENYVFYAVLPPVLRLPQELLSAVMQAAGITGFALFALRFPTDRSEGWRRWAERALPFVAVTLIVLAITGAGAEFGRPSHLLWLASFWFKAVIYPFIVAAFISKLHMLEPVERQRLRMVIFGCIPGLLFYLLAESVEVTSLWQPLFDRLAWSPPEVLLDACYLVNALVPISIGYAVMRRRVLPMDFIINRGLTLGIVTVIIAMSVEATVLSTHTFLEENHILSTLLLAVALVLFAPLIEGLKSIVNDRLDRFLFARLHRAGRALDEAALALTAAASTGVVDAAIVSEPCLRFELAAAALFALDDDGVYRISAEHGWPEDGLRTIAPDDPLVRTLLPASRTAATRAALGARSDLPAGAAAPELAVTLAPNAYVEAVALFGAHTDGSALTPDEGRVVTHFVRACGAVRAHLMAQEMRREVVRLRRLPNADGRAALAAEFAAD